MQSKITQWVGKFAYYINQLIGRHVDECVIGFNWSQIGALGTPQWSHSHPDFDICLAHVLFTLVASVRLT